MISRMVDQKGFDLIAALADDLPRLDASFVVLGTGEPRYQDLWTRLAAAHPDRIGVHDRLRRSAGASDRGGRRHLPDAVAIRAVRAEPDVQPALRHGAGRAGRRRARRHGDATTRPADRTSTGFKFRALHARGAARGAQPGAGALSQTARSGGRSSSPGCSRIIPGTVRPGSTSKYTSVPCGSGLGTPTRRLGLRAQGDAGRNDGSRERADLYRRQLRRDGPQVGRARARGFLGGVVRPLQAPGADGRRAGDRLRRQGDGRQAERRRQSEHRRASSRFAASRRCCSSRAARSSSRSSASRRRTTSRRSSTSISDDELGIWDLMDCTRSPRFSITRSQ